MLDCFMGKIRENLERIWGSFLNENCSSASLVDDWKILEIFAKYKIDFMLGDFSLAVCIFKKISYSCHVALHMHLEQGNHKDRSLIAINLIETGEEIRDQGSEP